MAVAQGYGKTVTSGSVFAYDTGDTVNSYRGEPTTNLALFSVISGITFNADYATLTSQVADYSVTYRGRPSLRCTSTGQWNIYKYPRSGNYTATSSTAFTFSWKMKWSDGRVPAFSNGYIYTDANYFYPAVTVTPLEDGWYLCQTTSSDTSSPVYLTGFTTTQYGTCYITDWQAEAKSHATPFTPAGNTRSATQGLLPLIGNSTIDLTNVSFDSNAQMVFDGTNDYIDTNLTNLISGTNPFTIEAVTNKTSGDYGSIIGNYGPSYDNLWFATAGLYLGGACYHSSYSTTMAGWHYSAVTRNTLGNTILYRDGVQVNTATLTKSVDTGINWRIGADVNGAGLAITGNIPLVKVYNRVLSAAEVAQNYRHYKTRFNLS